MVGLRAGERGEGGVIPGMGVRVMGSGGVGVRTPSWVAFQRFLVKEERGVGGERIGFGGSEQHGRDGLQGVALVQQKIKEPGCGRCGRTKHTTRHHTNRHTTSQQTQAETNETNSASVKNK